MLILGSPCLKPVARLSDEPERLDASTPRRLDAKA